MILLQITDTFNISRFTHFSQHTSITCHLIMPTNMPACLSKWYVASFNISIELVAILGYNYQIPNPQSKNN